jgi:hypothetical protein
MDNRTGDGVTEWVRAADAARMLGISRERVRQLIEAGALTYRREPKRRCWVLVADIDARLEGR